MTCYHPIQAWRSRFKNDNGKYPLVFNVQDGYADKSVVIPCGRCVGCRLERSRQWATRCMHEASMHDQNAFLTLTYRPEDLPANKGLQNEDLQKFWKRLRKAGYDFRYFACGEYGGKFGRPHYHAVVFGYWPPDAEPWSRTKSGDQLYVSSELSRIWSHGYVLIGSVTFESCAYVARYIMKKQLGSNIDLTRYCDLDTGEVKKSEYVVMSRRPGIGAEWINQYADEVLANNFVFANGHKSAIPRYYKQQLEKIDEKRYLTNKSKMIKMAKISEDAPRNFPDRLHDREAVQLHKASKLIRPLDDSELLSSFSSYDEFESTIF